MKTVLNSFWNFVFCLKFHLQQFSPNEISKIPLSPSFSLPSWFWKLSKIQSLSPPSQKGGSRCVPAPIPDKEKKIDLNFCFHISDEKETTNTVFFITGRVRIIQRTSRDDCTCKGITKFLTLQCIMLKNGQMYF